VVTGWLAEVLVPLASADPDDEYIGWMPTHKSLCIYGIYVCVVFPWELWQHYYWVVLWVTFYFLRFQQA
jgi:hypothetical protein